MIKDYYDSLSDYQKKRFDNYKAKAEEFFAKKKLLRFYHVEGYDSHSEGEIRADCWLSMTDEDVKLLQKYILEEYNKFDPEYPCDSWDDFMQTDSDFIQPFFEDLNTKRGLWDDMVVSRVESNEMIPIGIDFNDFTTCYRAKFFCYDGEEDKMDGPYVLNLELTDEEYILLLTLQLFEQRGFTFNRLNAISPDLFKKLNSEAEANFMNPRLIEQWKYKTYAIIFSEIINDAKEIEPDSSSL